MIATGYQGRLSLVREDLQLAELLNKRTSESPCKVVIVGGGFSGTVLTIQLLLRSSGQLSITVVNRAGPPGRGVAYGTDCEHHILNVSAAKMSAMPDDSEHFLRWLQSSGYA